MGVRSQSCTDVDTDNGVFTCTCSAGRFGDLCDSACDTGYALSTAFGDSPKCSKELGAASWSSLEAQCGPTGHLGSSTSAGVNAGVLSACHSVADANNLCFIGGSDTAAEGDWAWADGSPWSFTSWNAAAPNNNFGDEDCLAISTDGASSGEWFDVDCDASLPGVCLHDYALCANGVQDSDYGETGVDCGGDYCPLCGPVFSSTAGASGSAVASSVLTFTATFPEPVSGVVVDDFVLSMPGVTVTKLLAAQGGSGTDSVWVFSVGVVAGFGATPVSATVSIAEAAGSISPTTRQGQNNGFELVYTPPVPTFSSAAGAAGTSVTGTTQSFTATFTTAVSGITDADFGLSAGSLGVATSVAAGAGGSPNTEWVLTVTLSSPLADTTISVSMPADVAVPPNAAGTNNGFALDYVAPPCTADPCHIAEGFGSSCTNVDDLAGTFTCVCASGRYGTDCTATCPPGYFLDNVTSPYRCLGATDAVAYTSLESSCAGSLVSVHSAGENDLVRAGCTSAFSDTQACWLPADDLDNPGSLQYNWLDGSAFDYTNWKGVNPDNFNGQQHCVLMLEDGTWDDRKCSTNYPGVCEQDYSLCSNGVADVDAGELGVDCGGHGCESACTTATVVYSSSLGVSGATVQDTTLHFTATFGLPVAGVTAADFSLTTGAMGATTSVHAVDGSPSNTWVLEVTLTGDLVSATVAVAAMAAGSGSITPANEAGTSGYSFAFDPPTPTYSSTLGASGTVLNDGPVTVTATFDVPVSGVTAADFGVNAGSLSVSMSVAAESGGSLDTVWVLTIDILSGRTAGTITCSSMASRSGSISPPNEAGSGATYMFLFQPPTPVLSSSAGPSGSKVHSRTFAVTASFNVDVSGVTVADFGVNAGSLTLSTEVAAAGGATEADTWVLTVTVTSQAAASVVSFAQFSEASGAITPRNAPGSGSAFTLQYEPPIPTYTSSLGTSGSTVSDSPLSFTVTFADSGAAPVEVSGVQLADLRMHPGTMGVTTALAAVGGEPSDTWVLAVTPSSAVQPTTVSLQALRELAGSISPGNAAGAGGFSLLFQPPQPSYTASSPVSGATTASNVMTVTAVFSNAVTGVTGNDFRVNASSLSTTAVATALSGDPGTTWQLTITVLAAGRTADTITVTPMEEASGAISPTNQAASGSDPQVTFHYDPPVPTLSSSEGPSGTRVAGEAHTFTATFTSPVSDVSPDSFSLTSVGVGVSKSVASQGGSNTDTVWILTVTMSPPLADADLVVSLFDGEVTPPNVPATNNGFTLKYVAPPCEADPCRISEGIYGTACTNVDALEGTFECECASRYGPLCQDLCPPGYSLNTAVTPAACVAVTPNTTWEYASGNCSSTGGQFASIHSLAASNMYRSVCDAAGARTCWAAGSDAAFEGIWAWEDGSPWDFTNWRGVNPDDVRATARRLCRMALCVYSRALCLCLRLLPQHQAFGGQDCLVVLEDGEWDDRYCREVRPALCATPLSPCSNGLLDNDAEVGETAVDCGGICDPCSVSVVYSSSAGGNGTSVTNNVLEFTAVFSSPTQGVSLADFDLTMPSSLTAITSLTPVNGVPAASWVLTVTLTGGLQPASVSVMPMLDGEGFITPPTERMSEGFTLLYTPPVPSYSSGSLASGDVVASNQIIFTATFTVPVSGVTASDFGLTTNGLSVATPAVAAVGSQPAAQWVLVITVLDRPTTPKTLSVAAMPEASGAVSPKNAAGASGFELDYLPPRPTISSSEGVSGTRVAGQVHTFTATFTSAVGSISTADFGLVSVGIGKTSSVASAGGGTTDTVWVLTVTLSQPLQDAALSVSFAANVASPPNAPGTNNGFTLNYVAPPCYDDPCGIAVGRATTCTDVDDLAGTFECTCQSGLYGDVCQHLCPVGSVYVDSVAPPRCVATSQNGTWSDADGNCTAAGSTFASIHSKAESIMYWNICKSLAHTCWVAGSDAVTEGVWQWSDGSPWNYDNWLGVNPDDVRAHACLCAPVTVHLMLATQMA